MLSQKQCPPDGITATLTNPTSTLILWGLRLILEGFFWAILALFRAFFKAKTAKYRGGIGPLRLPRRDRELFSGYQLINGVIWILRTSRVEMQNYWPFFTMGRILLKSSFVIWNAAIFMHFWPFCTNFDGPVSWNRSCLAKGFLWPAIALLGMRISKIMLFWP